MDDVLYHVCYGEGSEGSLFKKNRYGENFWIDIDKFMQQNKLNKDVGPLDEKIWKRILQRDFSKFYFEERLILKEY